MEIWNILYIVHLVKMIQNLLNLDDLGLDFVKALS